MDHIGIGIYSVPEAAQLIHGSRAAIKRWLYGYDYAHRGRGETVSKQYHSAALWQPQHTQADMDGQFVGFRDLIELRAVRQFVAHGVPLLVVRRCLDYAKKEFGLDAYPLSARRFRTDGRTIFLEALQDDDVADMIDLRTRQYVFNDIIKPSLYEGIEYEGDEARRWFPEGRDRRTIVIDPARQFGKPILEGAGVPTATLYASWLAEGRDKHAVARAYEVQARHVEAAVRFEEHLAA